MNESAACPRCGYDQRGLIATWQDSCPLESTCTECGLVYSCAEVLRPEKFEPRWCVEYCRPERAIYLRACFRTLGRSFLPWRFWSHIKMSHRIRPKRIALYLLILLGPALLIYIALQTTAALVARSLVQQRLAVEARTMAGWAANARFQYDTRPELLQQLQQQNPENWEEMLRTMRDQFETARQQHLAMADRPPYLEHSPILHVLEAVFLPLASKSRLRIAYPAYNNSFPYTAPIQLWYVLAQNWLGPGAVASWFGLSAAPLASFAFGLALALLFPISLALLPMSRRKAKVRWAHIGRIAAYGTFIPLMVGYVLVALIILNISYSLRTGNPSGFEGPAMLLAIGGIPAGTLFWWAFAINRHLRMPHALAVTAVLMLLCFLTILAAVYLLASHWLFDAGR